MTRIEAAIEQLKKTPEIRVSTDWRSGRRHAWFPYHPGFDLNTRTVDALVRRGIIRSARVKGEPRDWRWATYVPVGDNDE